MNQPLSSGHGNSLTILIKGHVLRIARVKIFFRIPCDDDIEDKRLPNLGLGFTKWKEQQKRYPVSQRSRPLKPNSSSPGIVDKINPD